MSAANCGGRARRTLGAFTRWLGRVEISPQDACMIITGRTGRKRNPLARFGLRLIDQRFFPVVDQLEGVQRSQLVDVHGADFVQQRVFGTEEG